MKTKFFLIAVSTVFSFSTFAACPDFDLETDYEYSCNLSNASELEGLGAPQSMTLSIYKQKHEGQTSYELAMDGDYITLVQDEAYSEPGSYGQMVTSCKRRGKGLNVQIQAIDIYSTGQLVDVGSIEFTQKRNGVELILNTLTLNENEEPEMIEGKYNCQ